MHVGICCSWKLSFLLRKGKLCVLGLDAKRPPVSDFFSPERPLDALEGCVSAKRPPANIICSLKSPVQPSWPSITLINFWLHVSLEEIGKSTLNDTSVSFGSK